MAQQLVFILFLFAVFYFLLLRPQQQRVAKHQKLVAGLKAGDEVVTIGGIHGVIKDLTEDTVFLEVADNTKISINRDAIGKKK